MNYLLDSSAWLAHLLGEPGAQEISQFLKDSDSQVSISVLSIPEVYTRLRLLGKVAIWQQIWTDYSSLFAQVIPVSETIALQSIIVRSAASTRLPAVDGLIAATAAVHRLTLVHRDPHLIAIPESVLKQFKLPEK